MSLCLVWSVVGHASVIATIDTSISTSGEMICFSFPCITPPDVITFTLGFDNNPDRPNTFYTDLFVFERTLTAADVGNIYHINNSTSGNFDYFVSRMTNGVDEPIAQTMWLGNTRSSTDGSFQNVGGGFGHIDQESNILTFQNGYTGGPDLIGYNISRIDFLLTSLTIDVKTISPFDIQSSYEIGGVISINGMPNTVPEPSSFMLFVIGCICLIIWKSQKGRLA